MIGKIAVEKDNKWFVGEHEFESKISIDSVVNVVIGCPVVSKIPRDALDIAAESIVGKIECAWIKDGALFVQSGDDKQEYETVFSFGAKLSRDSNTIENVERFFYIGFGLSR